MIRQATKYDKNIIVKLMKEFRDESPIKHIFTNNNELYFHKLLDNILAGQGAGFLCGDAGLLLCIVLPTIWDDKVYALHELAWYVSPQHRGTTAGFRLFKQYIEYGEKLKKEGRIKYFTISKMPTSPNLEYSRYGFQKLDENWIK